jgi:H+/Cl- antiporter ClcA
VLGVILKPKNKFIMDLGIKKAIDNGDGNTIIYTALLAACIANFLPTIADSWYFYLEDVWNKEKEDGKISVERYWENQICGYYGITAGYYFILLLTMVALGKTDYSTKAKILLSLAGGGAVIGVIFKNIQTDKKLAEDKAKLTTTTP